MNLEYFKHKIEPLVESVEQNYKFRIEERICEYKKDIDGHASRILELDAEKDILQNILAQHKQIERINSSLVEKLNTVYGSERRFVIDEINKLNSDRRELHPTTKHRTERKIVSLIKAKKNLSQKIENLEKYIRTLRSTKNPTFSSEERDVFEGIVKEFNRYSKAVLKKHRDVYIKRYRANIQKKISEIRKTIHETELNIRDVNIQKCKYIYTRRQLSEHEIFIRQKDERQEMVTREDIEKLQKLKKNIGLDFSCDINITSLQQKMMALNNQVRHLQHIYDNPHDTFEFADKNEHNAFVKAFNEDLEFDIIGQYLVKAYNKYTASELDRLTPTFRPRTLELVNRSTLGLKQRDYSILLNDNGKIKILK